MIWLKSPMSDMIPYAGRWKSAGLYERFLRAMRKRVGAGMYLVTTHADEEMTADGLTIFDVERALLTGRIVERQRDHEWGGFKYRLLGESVDGDDVEVVWKRVVTGEIVVITVYRP